MFPLSIALSFSVLCPFIFSVSYCLTREGAEGKKHNGMCFTVLVPGTLV